MILSYLSPYLRLIRLHRPIGIWLLMLPCYWGVALGHERGFQFLKSLVLFTLGAFFMRSAGCALNDWVDRDLDLWVERTKTRPLAAGDLKPWQALTTAVICTGFAFVVWFHLNIMAQMLSLVALLVAIYYPHAKRSVEWPQVVLGLAFNSGVLIAAVNGYPTFRQFFASVSFYIAGVFWTLFYDTAYASQDWEDDEKLELKTSVLSIGVDKIKTSLLIFMLYSYLFSILAGLTLAMSWRYFLVLFICACYLGGQWYRFDARVPATGETLFQRSVVFGWGVFMALLVGR